MTRTLSIISILFFIFSCEKTPTGSTPVWGCMDSLACNYSADANRDDESCYYQNELYNCDGQCIATTSDGCVCGEILDECGECGGSGANEHYDCDGNCTSEIDCSGECGGTLILDCNGECGGLATADCSGDCGGTLAIDCNGECGGDAVEDCNGTCNGDFIEDASYNCCAPSSIDECGYCSGYGPGDSDFYENWEVLFEDNFNELSIDETKWNFEQWGAGAFNQELQAYTSSSDNAFIENDKLVIRALRENSLVDSSSQDTGPYQYTSARLTTQMNVDFKPIMCGACGGGEVIVEVRAKLPSGVGTWPAIWLLPTHSVYGGWPASGEIDIMEHAPGTTGLNNILSTVHTSAYNVAQNNQISYGPTEVPGATDDFITYKLTWSQDDLSVEVSDDLGNSETTLYHENDSNGFEYWPFDQDFFIILNLAIGGNMGGDTIDNSSFPQDLEIDYVQVSQRGCY